MVITNRPDYQEKRATAGTIRIWTQRIHRWILLSSSSIHFPLRGFLPEILAGKTYWDAHGKQPVINTRVGGVLRVPQVVQREVGRDDQRLAAAVTAVYHIENLFQSVFGAALHAEVVKDQQRIAAKAGNVLVAPLKAGGKVIEDKGKVRHVDGDFFLHEGVCDTARKVAFPGSYACLLYTSRCV